MQSEAWKALFDRVPREDHPGMMVVTSIGIEINVNSIQLLEDDYVVIRGRLGGTTDAGRIFFVPYHQINYVTFNREIKEAQIQEMLGLDSSGERLPPALSEAEAAAAAALDVKKEELPPEPTAPATAPAPAKQQPSRMALLDRIRSKMHPNPSSGESTAGSDK